MICPKCLGDYLEGVKICVSCHVLLVGNKVSEFSCGTGHLVHFITLFSRYEAHSAKNLLENHNVQAFVSMDDLQGVRLWIRKEDAPLAIKIFQENSLAGRIEENTH